jgi:acetoin utilization deacetylase AcuC-like enzyme
VKPFRCIFHERYQLPLGDHVFPSLKYRLIREALRSYPIALPGPATREDLLRVHTPGWTGALLDGTISYREVQKLEIPYSKPLVDGFLFHTGGSILAAQLALEDGSAFHIGGGFHHAFPAHGEGFCAMHDVAVAIRRVQAEGRIERAMIIDTDVHQGNGSAAVFATDESVFTLSLHQLNNYPFEKPPSDLDVALPDGMGDTAYLDALEKALDQAFGRFAPQLIAYVAGSDPFEDDQLGGLKLSMAGMYERDLLVCRAAARRGIPLFITLAGGYARRMEDTIQLHANSARALAENHF